jgi:HlyD family secretion protein
MTVKNLSLSAIAAALLAATAFSVLPSHAPAATEAAAIAAPTPPSIRVAAAERRKLVETLPVTGTIVARQEAAAGTDLNGLTVTALNADEGDRVAKGEVLAVLDRSGLDTQLAQIDASRAQAEAGIAQMRAQIGDAEVAVRQAGEALERVKALQAKGVATKAELDNAVNAADSASAKLASANKALAASEAQLGVIDAQKKNVLLQIEKTEVKAPADGLVLARSATLGGIVSASGGPLFRIAIDGRFELDATVPETALPGLRTGMKAAITVAGASRELEGSIRLIGAEVDSRSRLGSIRIALPADCVARSGNFARASIEIANRDGVAVPVSAVLYKGREAFLKRVDNGVVATVPVTLGLRADGYVEIASGLEEGQQVVSRAGTFVADGDHVTPVLTSAGDDVTGAITP